MKLLAKSAFHEQRRWEPIYTGGQVLVDKAGRWLVTAAGDEVFVTDCASGERLCVVPGVCPHLCCRDVSLAHSLIFLIM